MFVCLAVFSISGYAAAETGRESMKLKISAGGKVFTAAMEDNATVKAFVAKLPITLPMIELGGNEKYYNFSENFIADKAAPAGTINAGDLMVWDSGNTLVLFYKIVKSGQQI
jgi:hypothetical protein